MRHCYSTGDDLLLARNACKPHLATLLRYIKIYVLDKKFWLLCWRIRFFLSTGVKDFLTKSENSNSKFHKEVRVTVTFSLLTVPPLQGWGGWGGRTTWCKNEKGTASRWVSEMLQTLGEGGWWDLQFRSLQIKERIATVRTHLWCSTSEEGQGVSPSKPAQAKGFQEV